VVDGHHGRAAGCECHQQDIRRAADQDKERGDIGSGHSVIVKRVPLPLMTEDDFTTAFLQKPASTFL